MKKLKIEHLAPYLPYELKVNYRGKTCLMIGLTNNINKNIVRITIIDGYNQPVFIKFIKPILRPLSDFTNQMVIDCVYENKAEFIDDIINKDIPLKIFNDLISNHWDVFELIKAELAVDINTIK